ncbi:PAS domain S-box protein [Marinobacter salinisoli]|uniref:histidine kinase n=1 Tax=Marinobacter salinisoli TaxID=2769486 RepID=A0ABX7MSQ3_9GAMM|nr:MHYT domain-containing protein [Marinobacter salinisoli]QSP95338.1 PAS domain S-box protein [Marinobacter salinisoli]
MSLLDQYFLINAPDGLPVLTGSYDPLLVTLSLAIAIGASYMALALAAAARRSTSALMERLHLITGSASLGFGIWSMHFIGMLAFELPSHVHYHPLVTALSALPSLVASWLTLSLLARRELTRSRLLAGGMAVGAGIGAMHYLGMAAMDLSPTLRYDPLLFTLSIVVAVLLGTLALWISFGLRRQARWRGSKRRLLAGTVMGLAIAGMHYTAMEAARFIGEPAADFVAGSGRHTNLALVIAAITVGLSLFAAGVNAVARYRGLMYRSQATASELRAIIDAAVDGIIKISDRGVILSFNESAERIFGYRADEAIGQNVSMLMPSPHRDEHDRYLNHYLQTGERHIIGSGREVWAVHRDGHKIPVRLAIGESRLGGQSTFVGFVTDISERHRMETDLRRSKEQAEQAAEAKSAFLANMSHEIRTPMNAIIGFTDLVLGSQLTDDQAKHLGTVRTSAKSLLALLNDILDTAKLDGGHTSLETRDFSLRSVCEQLLATQSLNAQHKGLTLQLDYQADDYFQGDPLRVQQVVLNLFSNAVKFTQAGYVKLRVRQSGDNPVVIDIEDTGIGIPEDRLDKIFDPFVQADASTTRRFGGTGLGTTIARQLTELMGGRISVSSVPQKGTRFRIALPLKPGSTDVSELDPEQETPLPPLTILVADDVKENLELLRALLTQRGHTVVTATNGKDALQRFGAHDVDLVLMDVQMPELNGHQATRALRTMEARLGRSRTPVIALTAGVLEQDQRNALAAGMDAFAVKPLSLPKLSAEIARLLDLPAVPAASQTPCPAPAELVNRQVLHQLWPSAASHRHAVGNCLRKACHFLDRLSELDASEALSEAHRLKGMAGNLGLIRLVSALDDLEHEIRQERPVTPHRVHQLQAQLDQITQWLADHAHEANESGPASVGVQAVDDQRLSAMIDQLRRGELPDQAFAQLRAGLPADCADAVSEALDNFDTECAADLLAAFRDTLEERSC